MTAQQGPSGAVMLAEDGAVHIVEAVAGHQSISARGTIETLERKKHTQKVGDSLLMLTQTRMHGPTALLTHPVIFLFVQPLDFFRLHLC